MPDAKLPVAAMPCSCSCHYKCAFRAAAGLLSHVGQDRIFKYTLQDPTQYGMVDNCDWKLESDTSQYSTETAYIYVGEWEIDTT